MQNWTVSLWNLKHFGNSGLDACLNVESKARKAWVNLKVGLGETQPQKHHNHPRKSPAQQRRRERRAAAWDAARVEGNQLDKDATEEDTVENETSNAAEIATDVEASVEEIGQFIVGKGDSQMIDKFIAIW